MKTTYQLALDAERDLPYSYQVTVGKRDTYFIFEVRDIRNMDTELKIVVCDVQRQITAIPTGKTS